jgi:ABC-type nitrate/sulfonate/bicarbonate transport system substrate-binding protein
VAPAPMKGKGNWPTDRAMLMKRQAQFVVLLGILWSFSCGAAEAPIKLRVAYPTNAAGYAILWVTKDAGFFKKSGLEAELLYIQSSTLIAQAMAGGSVGITTMAGGSAIEANLQGLDLVLLASIKKRPSLTYLAAVKEITRPEQLKGRRVAVSRVGSSSDSILRLALRKLGLNPEKDVTILSVGNSPLRMAALQSGQIDATILTVEDKVAGEKFGLNILLDLRDLGLEFLETDVVTTKSFIQRDEEAVRRFMKAIVEGVHFFKTQKTKSMEIMAKYMRVKDPRIIEVGYDFHAEVYEKAPYPAVAAIQAALEEIAHRNPKAREAKPAQFIETKFVRQLDESGYIDSLYR